MVKLTLADLQIGSLDEAFIERLEREFDVSSYDVYLSNLLLSGDVDSPKLTNWIIYNLFEQIIEKEVKNREDKEKMLENLFINCLDSFVNINEYELKTKQAKEVLDRINNN